MRFYVAIDVEYDWAPGHQPRPQRADVAQILQEEIDTLQFDAPSPAGAVEYAMRATAISVGDTAARCAYAAGLADRIAKSGYVAR